MKMKLAFLGLIALSLVLLSCQMPQSSLDVTQPPATPVTPAGTQRIAVETDLGRSQGVYINEQGQRIDIRAEEYPGGPMVNCVAAVDIAVIQDTVDADSLPVKALVIGTREDGKPGVWEILQDDSIRLPSNEDPGAKAALLLESKDSMDKLRECFGWVYHVTAISEDGKIIVGYAENVKGFTLGRVEILPGTTIGVYWRVWKSPNGRYSIVSPARVIGTWEKPKPNNKGKSSPHGTLPFHRILRQLKLFCFGWLESYLVMADSVHYDPDAKVYIVTGTDQDGQPAIAKIYKNGKIVIEPAPVGDRPDLTVVSIAAPTAPVRAIERWNLGATVKNSGTAAAGPSTLEYRLSRDAVLDQADGLIATSNIPDINAGAVYEDSLPDKYALEDFGGGQGTYYIFVIADAGSAVTESDEANNSANTPLAVIYDRVIIDTYYPTGPGVGFNFIDLFSSSGDPDADDPWTEDDKAQVIAWSDGITGVNPDPQQTFYAYIEYTGGLNPGTYYVRMRAVRSTDSGAYAIRVLTSWAAHTGWYFDSLNGEDTPYDTPTSDDFPISGGIPTNPVTITINDRLNRYITAGDIDWFKLVLP